jgi:hypothetical protein
LPQFFGSMVVFAHDAPQTVFGAAHTEPHVPPAHVSPAGHTFPQVPQLEPSVLVLVHAPPHEV